MNKKVTFSNEARKLVGDQVVIRTTNGTIRGKLLTVHSDHLDVKVNIGGSHGHHGHDKHDKTRVEFVRIDEIVSIRKA